MRHCGQNKKFAHFTAMAHFAIGVIVILVLSWGIADAKSIQRNFQSAEEAVKAIIDAARADDTTALRAIMGPGSKKLVFSGDPVEDKAGREWFVKQYDAKNKLQAETPEKMTLHIGNDDWPFPIPLLKTKDGWVFDTAAGKKELLARRIGDNELNAVKVCLAYVDAQKEYAHKISGQNKSLLQYAQRFTSTEGMKDGLYWQAAEGEDQSPMGPLFAAAREEGYGERPLGGRVKPYHGYYYRILKAQGANAAGGALDYVVEGKMIGGFALIAYPAQYRSSGVMTFIVNHDGVVFQKDLGRGTSKAVRLIKAYDPDKSWVRVKSGE